MITFKELLENKGNLSIIETPLLKKFLKGVDLYGKDSELIPFSYTKKSGFDKFFVENKKGSTAVYCKGEDKSYILYMEYGYWNYIEYNKISKTLNSVSDAKKSVINKIVASNTCYFIKKDDQRETKREQRFSAKDISDKSFKKKNMWSRDETDVTYRFGDKMKKYIDDKREKFYTELKGRQQNLVKGMLSLIGDPEYSQFSTMKQQNEKIISQIKALSEFDPTKINTRDDFISAKKYIDKVFESTILESTILESAGNLKIFPSKIVKRIASIDNLYGRDSEVIKLDAKNKTINRVISKLNIDDPRNMIVGVNGNLYKLFWRWAEDNDWNTYYYDSAKKYVEEQGEAKTSEINKLLKDDYEWYYISADENRKKLHNTRTEPIEDKHFNTSWDYVERKFISSYKVNPELIQKILSKSLSDVEFKLKKEIYYYISRLISGKKIYEIYKLYSKVIEEIKNYNRLKKRAKDADDLKKLKEILSEIDDLNF